MMQRFNNQKVRCQVSGVRCEREGFSLLEIVIVVALIGLLAALGSSFYGNFTRSVDLDSVAKSIVSDLKAAQSKAMSGYDADGDGISDKWGVCFRNPSGAGGDLYEIYSLTTSCTSGSSATVRGTIYLQNGITFTTPGDNVGISVIFEKITGTATVSSGSTIVISGNNQTKTITITVAGLISSN